MSDKVVLVTGVKGGIGSAIAQEFHEKGYKVIGLDIIAGESSCCDVFHEFDLFKFSTDELYRLQQKQWFNENIRELDVLINNAAVQRLSHLAEIQLNDWNETMAVNLTGPMLLSQYFLNILEKRNGSIVNISSIHRNLTKSRFVAYATSKSALVGLTKAMSVDLQGRVRVNSISPAAIDTQMLREGFDFDEEKVDQLNKIHPIQRIGRPNEVARLCFFLSENQFDFVNGANIEMDGGISNVLKDLD